MKTRLIILAVMTLFLLPMSAMGAEDSLQKILDDITVSGTSTVKVGEALADSVDSYWSTTSTGGATTTLIIELAGYAASNTLGIYDMYDSSKKIQLFAGSADAGDRVTVQIWLNGQVAVSYYNYQGGMLVGGSMTIYGDENGYFADDAFGFYMTTGGGKTWYSDSDLNTAAGGGDQMLALRGEGQSVKLPGASGGTWSTTEYVLAWEDLPYGSSDKDYNDMVVMVESIEPVPVPAAVLLGVLGLGFAGRKLRKHA